MKKRIISALLAVMMLSAQTAVFAENEARDFWLGKFERYTATKVATIANSTIVDSDSPMNTGDGADKAPSDTNFDFLKAVGVVDGTYTEKAVTRGEFVTMAVRALGFTDELLVRTRAFADVDDSHSLSAYINTAASLGIISGDGGYFNPDAPISYTDAVTMAVRTLGRDDKAQIEGGYPMGYLTAAKRFDIISSSSANYGENVPASALYALMAETIKSPEYAQLEGITNYKVTYKTGDSILNVHHDMYIVEDVVTAVGPTSIYTLDYTDVNTVKVGDLTLKGDYESMIDCIGSKCEVVYSDSEENGMKVVYSEISKKNKVLILLSEDIDGFDGNRYKYYVDNKVKYADTDSISLIYNGRLASGNIDDLYAPENGSVVLIDNDDDGKYEVAISTSYKDMIVGAVDNKTQKLYDKYDSTNIIDVENDSNDRIVEFKNAYGTKMYPGIVSEGSVVTYTASNDGVVVRAHVATETVNGKIERYSISNSKKTVVIDGKEYEISDGCYNRCKNYLANGKSVTLTINVIGQVADITDYVAKDEQGMLYAYVIRHTKVMEGDEGYEKIKLLNYDGEILSFNLIEKAKIDGEIYKKPETQDAALTTALANGNVIRYMLNENKEICEIDTAYLNPEKEDADASLQRMTYNPTVNTWSNGTPNYFTGLWHKSQSGGGQFGEKFYWNTSRTKVFAINNGETEETMKYRVATSTYPFGNDKLYNPEIYKCGEGFYVDVLVHVQEQASDTVASKQLYIVQGIEKVVDEFGDVMMSIEANSGSAKMDIMLDEELLELRDIDKGDIVRCDLVGNKVSGRAIQKVYDYDDDELLEKGQWFAAEYLNRKGYVYDKADDIFSLYMTDDINDLATYNEDKIYASKFPASIISYSKNSKGDVIIEDATANSINTYKGVGTDCSKILARYVYVNCQQIIIIN